MSIAEDVYDTLLNNFTSEYAIDWVEPIFVPGDPCFEAYAQMHTAYARLRQKLGATDEDPDA